jgi:UDP-2,3-diacylglucosamine pyrophosphatase LpxH
MGHIVLLSDLHMGAGGPREQFRADAALTAQLENFAADPTVSDIVLLGDTFDLSGEDVAGSAEREAVTTLREVLHAHPDVVAALRAVVRRGMRLHVVQGNHDVELAGIDAQATLRGALAPEDAGAVQFLPWLYHVPGLLLAEHGNQHHDLNAFDTVLRPLSGGDRLVVQPFGGELSRLRNRHQGAPLLHRVAWAAAREGARLSGPTRRDRRADYRRDVLPGYAAEVGLTEDCVLRLDRLGQHQPAAIMARLVRQSIRRRSQGYLVRAAHAVREALGDATPPFLVMGHSHGADARLLRSDQYDAPVVYLNTGTWSLRGPRERDTTLPPVTSTWVEIEPSQGSGPARAWVLHLADDGTPTVLAEADATGHVDRAPDASPRVGIRHSDYAP